MILCFRCLCFVLDKDIHILVFGFGWCLFCGCCLEVWVWILLWCLLWCLIVFIVSYLWVSYFGWLVFVFAFIWVWVWFFDWYDYSCFMISLFWVFCYLLVLLVLGFRFCVFWVVGYYDSYFVFAWVYCCLRLLFTSLVFELDCSIWCDSLLLCLVCCFFGVWFLLGVIWV